MMIILSNYENKYIELREKYDPWKVTGPLLISKLDSSTLTMFPPVYFYPIHWNGITDCELHKKNRSS